MSGSEPAAPATPRAPFPAFGHLLDYELREPRTDGSGAATTVLFVHALAGDRALLAACCDAACADRGLRRLHVDLPGHGRSTGNAEAASADHLAAALAALARAEVRGPLLVVGYGYGGYLAQALVAELDVAALFLACPVIEPELRLRARPPRHVVTREPLAFVDEHERATFEEVAVAQSHEVLARYRELLLPASRATDRAFLAALRGRYARSRPIADSLASFARPVDVACGRHDHWVGFEDAARLVALVPDGALRVIPRAGQLLPIEAPGAFAAAFADWLDRALPR